MSVFAIIDTNVLVSAMMKPQSVPGQVVKESLNGQIIPVVNWEIMDEYKKVLRRLKFGFDPRDVSVLLKELEKRAVYCDASTIEDLMPDPKDIVCYAVTMEKRQDQEAYLVTGNIKHFPEKPFVVTPREMLAILTDGK